AVAAGQHIGIAVRAQRAVVRRRRVVPGAARQAHHAGADRVGQLRAGEAGAARVVDADQVAILYAARPRVVGVDRDGLAARDLAHGADGAGVHLAVQAVARLAGDEVQRIACSRGAAEPFGRLDPARMRRAVVVAEAGDALRVELDAAGRRRQPV